MRKDRVRAEIEIAAPDLAGALTTLDRHGLGDGAWREVAWFCARKIGESLRYCDGQGAVNVTIRRALVHRFGSSPAVVALVEVLPTDQPWTKRLLAPVICTYLGIPNAEGLRQTLP